MPAFVKTDQKVEDGEKILRHDDPNCKRIKGKKGVIEMRKTDRVRDNYDPCPDCTGANNPKRKAVAERKAARKAARAADKAKAAA